jgi:hypothetical protein
VRFATRTEEPFGGLLAWTDEPGTSNVKVQATLPARSLSPSVQTFDLVGEEVRVTAVAGECRPGSVKAGRLLPGAAPVRLVLEPAYRLRGRLLDERGSPRGGGTVTLALLCDDPDGFLTNDQRTTPSEAVAALLRDRWGVEHLGEWVAEAGGARWMTTKWNTDKEGRFDAFTPLPVRRIVLFAAARVLDVSVSAVTPFRDQEFGDLRLPPTSKPVRFRLLWTDGTPVAERGVLACEAARRSGATRTDGCPRPP